jgi:hypothetical protein
VRPESDVQGNHRSEAPACHRCGLPLLEDAEYCPFCERWLDESTVTRVLGRRRGEVRRIAGVPERALLLVGATVFAVVALAGVIAAFTA